MYGEYLPDVLANIIVHKRYKEDSRQKKIIWICILLIPLSLSGDPATYGAMLSSKTIVSSKPNGGNTEILCDDIDVPHYEIEKTLSCRNMRMIIDRLEKMTDTSTIKSILMRVRHGFE